MMTSNVNRSRRLEIMDKMDYFEERMCVLPHTRQEAQRTIKELRDELELLEMEYHIRTRILEVI